MAPTQLSEADWKARHRVVVGVLLVHFPLLFLFSLYEGTDAWITKATFSGQSLGTSLYEAAIPAILGLVSLLPRLPRRVASTVAALGLVLASAIFTHLSGGFIEAHFHFFVVVGLVSVYVDWVPLSLAVIFVVVHHGIVGSLSPGDVFNHPAAIAHPWRWALIHSAFIFGLAVTQLVNIGLAQRAMAASRDFEWDAQTQLADRRAAEAVAMARGDFLRHISHEVRTPLNAILGMTNLMARDGNPNQQDRLDVINASGQHLVELIQELLDMNRIDQGQITIHSTPVALDRFLRQILRIVQDQSGHEGLNFTLQNEGPSSARFDATRVRQILINLLGNAVKYAPSGTIRLHACTSDGMLEFGVTDEGPGISPDDVERIFEPYQQVGPETTRRGVGLGLAISRRLAQAMNGSLRVRSDAGVGTTFTLSIPLEAVEELPAASPDRWRDWASGRRVLVAEDDPFSAMVASEFLQGGGVHVTVVEDGAQAVQESENDYDAILLDARMPIMDGLAACRQIRANGVTTFTVGLSARASAADEQAAIDAGMDAYLTKPLNFDELLVLLQQRWGVVIHE